ncbi:MULTISPECIES: alpha/beta fold hydrolase [Helicobacter]|uniref:AB hydrolase-1 domain-containing protein n=1 Tax=Helicobacter bilis ATCC 43879 TaxID=613026 RepID=C3XIR6_9HELI|nr:MULTISPECIES: alpha/beta fold hydrolase [Helicobacter]EEO24905.1 hypothetical protein HRAG_01962 [Helicobacter bilis ATCC 43879]
MENKLLINKMKNAAELAWAAYGYYDLMTSDTNQLFVVLKDEKGEDKTDFSGNPVTQEITLTDIMDSSYAKHNVVGKDKWGKDFETVGTLKGYFSPTQAKRFFEKYDLLKHCPNTHSGFSATLFKDTKADSKDSEYTLAIRGTEFKLEQIKDLINDYYIGTNNNDMNRVIEQYFDMLFFYEETLKPLMQEKGITKINVIGHSLGGYLTQLFALSYPSIINEVYTYNTSLESRSVA